MQVSAIIAEGSPRNSNNGTRSIFGMGAGESRLSQTAAQRALMSVKREKERERDKNDPSSPPASLSAIPLPAPDVIERNRPSGNPRSNNPLALHRAVATNSLLTSSPPSISAQSPSLPSARGPAARVPPPAPPNSTWPSSPGVEGQGTTLGGGTLKRNSLSFLVNIVETFIQLYGPTIILLENLQDFDTWSWKLLVKVAETLSGRCLLLATSRPDDLPLAANTNQQLQGKKALHQKMAMMYRLLLNLPTTQRILLEPFNIKQTRTLMQIVAKTHFPDQYVIAIREKTGGMPHYIEEITEFIIRKPLTEGNDSVNVNLMIRNLNFQQVIIERVDRLRPGCNLLLKVASIMGQWVDLEILHRFYPIQMGKDELRGLLLELERGNFLKATEAKNVWEYNMVERDIVYEIIPHFQRRQLHAKLAQELERSLEENQVATLTTVAYHWNQACAANESTEPECTLKAIEYWNKAAESAYAGSSLMEALRLYQKASQLAEYWNKAAESAYASSSLMEALRLYQKASQLAEQLSTGTKSAYAGSSLMEALRLYQKASQLAEVLGESLDEAQQAALMEPSRSSSGLGDGNSPTSSGNPPRSSSGEGGTSSQYVVDKELSAVSEGGELHGVRAGSYTAANATLRRQKLNWSLVSRISRAQWEKSMASCCLGIVLQHCYDNNENNYPDPATPTEKEVEEIRDILLVLIITAEHYSLEQDQTEYIRLLTFCDRTCRFFHRGNPPDTDPFVDIRSACNTRIRAYKDGLKNHRKGRGNQDLSDYFDLPADNTERLHTSNRTEDSVG
eukprot:gene29281-12524_t